MEIGAKQLGAGCPTGPAMPPGRRFGLGGASASPHSPHLQPVLPVHRERHGGRGPLSGSVFEGIPDAGELSLGTWRFCNMDDLRHTEPADRPLPSNEAGPYNRLARRCHASDRKQRVGGATSRRASAARRIEFASTGGFDQAFPGIAGGCYIARFAAVGICRDSAESGRAGRYGKVTHQSRTYRIGTNFATNGSRAIMSRKALVMASFGLSGDYRKWAGGLL